MWWWTFRLDTSLPHAGSNSWQAHPVWSLIIISTRQQILVEAIVQHLHKCLWHLRYSELRQAIPVSYCLIKKRLPVFCRRTSVFSTYPWMEDIRKSRSQSTRQKVYTSKPCRGNNFTVWSWPQPNHRHIASSQAGILAHICLHKTVRTYATIHHKLEIKALAKLPYWAKPDDLLKLSL